MEQVSRPRESVAREVGGAAAFAFGPFLIRLTERSLYRSGLPIRLGGRAFDILALLVQRAGQVVRHDELITHVWTDVRVSPGTHRVHLTAVRKALGCRPDHIRYIVNVPGRGYCFVAPVAPAIGLSHRSDEGQPNPVRDHEFSADSLNKAAPDKRLQRQRRSASRTPANKAEQLLATPNTHEVLTSAIFKARRGLDEAFGGMGGEIAPGMNGSSSASGLRSETEAGDVDMKRKELAVAAAMTLLTWVAGTGFGSARADTLAEAAASVTHYRTATVSGVDLFYREAGPPDAPVVLLLHGFPTSSHMFRNLIPMLSDRYHVIAPDYPGFGQSAAPDHAQFAYTFAHYANLVDELLQKLGTARYAMYVMDYGAPVGYRLALLHPERVTALIVQNGNAYAEGLGAFWDPIRAYWADGSEAHRQALGFLVAPETTKFQYTDGVGDVSRISPDNWVHDQALLDRPGNKDIQLDLFHDYGSNVPLYPQFQAFFRKYQPPTLIVWGKNDKIFPAAGANPYLRDLPKAELHLLDTGHFALEDKLDVMAPMIRDFLDRSVAPK